MRSELTGVQEPETDTGHYCNNNQSARVGGGREDFAHGRETRASAHQPLWSAQAAVSRESTSAAPRTDLYRVARSADCQPDQLRCQGSVQRGVQGKTAAEDEGTRHTTEAAEVGRGILLRAHSVNPGQRTGF